MFTGIDIGGTNTDIAFLKNGCITTIKVPNEAGFSRILDEAGTGANIALSTSRPLNRLVFERTGRLYTLTIPGPGLVHAGAVRGAVTIRGDVAEEIDPDEIRTVLREVDADYLAIAGKFSVRNPELEEKAREIAREFFRDDRIALSWHAGGIGFLRRKAAAEINARIKEVVMELYAVAAAHASGRDIFFMKGDGGLASPGMIFNDPSKLYHSSQAAVVLGAHYLTGEDDALVIDVGGTTTSLIPMVHGRAVDDLLTFGECHAGIRGIRSISLPFGGDSVVDGGLLPIRRGPPRAFGGKTPTLTDALSVCGHEVGGTGAADVPDRDAAKTAVHDYFRRVSDAISVFSPSVVIGTGYLAPYIIPGIAGAMGVKAVIPDHAGSANAVGAAVSRISLSFDVHYDSERRRLIINGNVRHLKDTLTDEELIDECREELIRTARSMGSPADDCEETVLTSLREYDVIRNGVRPGKVIDLCISIPPGISSEAP